MPRAVVINRAISVGAGSILGAEVRLSAPHSTVIHDVVMGLGGRPVTRAGLRRLVVEAVAGELPTGVLHYADLDYDVVARELARETGLVHEEVSR